MADRPLVPMNGVTAIVWGMYVRYHLLDIGALAFAKLLGPLPVDEAEVAWQKAARVTALYRILSPMVLPLFMSMLTPAILGAAPELPATGAESARLGAGASMSLDCTAEPSQRGAPELQDCCHMHVFSLACASMACFLSNTLLDLWLEHATERLAWAEARSRLSKLRATCTALHKRVGALGLEPSGTHPFRLPPVPLAGNGAAIGCGIEALRAFAGPRALAPMVIQERCLSAVHCVIGHSGGSSGSRACLFVDNLSENGVWKNRAVVSGRERIDVGDTLTLHRCVQPYIELSYRVVDAKAVAMRQIKDVNLEGRELALRSAARDWIKIRCHILVRAHRTADLRLSILLVLAVLPLGLLQLSWRLEVSIVEYLRAVCKLLWHLEFGFVTYMLTGVMFGSLQSMLCCACAAVAHMDRRIAEQIVSSPSQLFLFVMHLALQMVLAFPGPLRMLAWNRRGLKVHLAGAEAEWEAKASEAEAWATKAASKLEESWWPEKPPAPPPAPDGPSPPQPPRGARAARAVPTVDPADLKCPICLEAYKACVALLPCGHNLCERCCKDYFSRLKAPRCPYTCVVEKVVPNELARALLDGGDLRRRLRERGPGALVPAGGCSVGDLCRETWYGRVSEYFPSLR